MRGAHGVVNGGQLHVAPGALVPFGFLLKIVADEGVFKIYVLRIGQFLREGAVQGCYLAELKKRFAVDPAQVQRARGFSGFLLGEHGFDDFRALSRRYLQIDAVAFLHLRRHVVRSPNSRIGQFPVSFMEILPEIVASGVGLIDPDDDMPPPATPRRATSSGGADAPMMGAVGISQKVASLETAVLGQNFNQDPLPARVSRLEKTVFQSAPDANADLSLPVRVSKLLEKVPIRTKPTQSPNMASKQRGSADDFDDDDMSMGSMGSMSGLGGGQIASSRNSVPRGSGGLGKIINSIGNMLGGGYGAGYAMPAGTMMRDPSTGYLIDGSGNMINPTTGMIMGRSTTYSTGMPMGMGLSTGIPVMPATGYASPYNAYPYGNALPMGGYPYNTGMPMGGYSSFNNGFSPYGIGGGGIRFGTGGFGMGGMRMGGMWP